jgi:plastocyanin
MRRFAVLPAALAAAVTLAACGGSDKPAASGASSSNAAASTSKSSGAYGGGSNSSSSASTSSSSAGKTVKIAADPGGALKFTESTVTAKAGEVTIDFSNQSQVPHAVEIEGNGVEEKKTKVVTGADAPPLKLKLKPGTYTFYCPVDGHRAAGMEGKLVVR